MTPPLNHPEDGPQLYQHYKGGLYVVIAEATDSTNSADDEPFVVYYSLTTRRHFIRAYDEFHEDAEPGIPRFRRVDSPADVVNPDD